MSPTVFREVEVTNVSRNGFWLLVHDQELFVPFDRFPWFRETPIGKLTNVELPSLHHLYWPDLDIDLAVESILHPEAVSAAESKSDISRPGTEAPNSYS